MSKIKRIKNKKRLHKLRKHKFSSLLTAALAIPSIAASLPAYSQEKAADPIVRIFYADYEDRQPGSDRMRVKAPIAWFKTPLSEAYELEGSYVFDSMSGASPYYYNTLSGASVDDTRRAGDLKLTKYFDGASVALGGIISSEDDYLSRTALSEVKIWSEDKNTTLDLGMAYSSDDISSSIQESLNESRTTFNFLVGVTQVIDEVSIVQSNLTYSNGDGYFSDPYKPLDNRPGSREQWAWLTRYNRYIEQFDASLHFDYRFYIDTWGINSQMFEVAWYQPFGNIWTIRPNVRYYSQSAADFFASDYPPDTLDQFLTADQRLSAFGGLTTGVKLIADLGKGYSCDVSFSYLQQKPGWKLGSGGSSVIDSFYARFITVGITKKF